MLKFTTTTPFDLDMPMNEFLKTKPLIKLKGEHKIEAGTIKGQFAIIVGKAYELAGFFLPCFYEGNITELDKKDGNIYMVLPEGEFPISATLNDEKIYLLDLKTNNK